MRRKLFKGIGSIISILSLAFLLCSCQTPKQKKYYQNIDNYITEQAIVDNIIYDEKYEYIVFWLSDIDEAYQTTEFIIREDSAQIILRNGVLEEITIGDTITFTSAPALFGNGYFMPIVELSKENKTYLTFEDGYYNLTGQKANRRPENSEVDNTGGRFCVLTNDPVL